MNVQGLVELAKNAAAWSAAYVALKEALIRAGVEPAEAAQQASVATSMAGNMTDDAEEGDVCPLCGRGGG